jgi:hypothetical protein
VTDQRYPFTCRHDEIWVRMNQIVRGRSEEPQRGGDDEPRPLARTLDSSP